MCHKNYKFSAYNFPHMCLWSHVSILQLVPHPTLNIYSSLNMHFRHKSSSYSPSKMNLEKL